MLDEAGNATCVHLGEAQFVDLVSGADIVESGDKKAKKKDFRSSDELHQRSKSIRESLSVFSNMVDDLAYHPKKLIMYVKTNRILLLSFSLVKSNTNFQPYPHTYSQMERQKAYPLSEKVIREGQSLQDTFPISHADEQR